ncbi:MAG: hypothetical protein IJ597_04620 [Synergistaceae bacterium]|nr:hypothetical protein [Synergistaceae bacterium]
MKKTLAILLTLCVILGATVAFAQPENTKNFEGRERHNKLQAQQQRQQGEFCQPNGQENFEGHSPRHRFGGFEGQCHGGFGRMNFTPDMPKEIREKAVELAKLRIDLEEAMSSRPVNKAKALDTYAKMQKLEQEIEMWRFTQKLDQIEEFRKQRELNKKVPPVPIKENEKEQPAPESK